jgi:6-phosphofructokinase 1
MSRIGLLTSGGDAPGMNAAIRAVTRYGIEKGFEVYGIHRGYEGLLDGEMEQLDRRSVGDILHRGGTILKTARCKRFFEEEGRKRAAMMLDTFDIDHLVVIGGNGSFEGASKLMKLGVDVICIPGTIDNDLAYTEMTIGFDTAVNTVLDAVSRIRDTSAAHDRTTVIEVMGRECGDIALYSGIAGGAESVLVPEVNTDLEEVARKVLTGMNNGRRHSIIIKAEGYPVASDEIVKYLSEVTGRDIRLVVLSYLQRGGSPTLRDRMFATECGCKAVDLLSSGIVNKAIGLAGGEVMGFGLDEALAQKREFDRSLYDAVDILSK